MLFFIIKTYLDYTNQNNHQHFLKKMLLFRSIISFVISFLLLLIITPYLINWFKKLKIRQIIRHNGPPSHLCKDQTPTMGGILIIFSITISIILCSDLSNTYNWYVFFILITYGIIGVLDDYKKIYFHNPIGLSPLYKFLLLSIIAIILLIFIFYTCNTMFINKLIVPIFHNIVFQNKILYSILAYLTIVGTSNSVNLTDGLDGLVIVPILLVTSSFIFVIFLSSNEYYSHYFNVLFIPDVYELIVFCSAIVGSSLGFLWFNTYPAKIFMGDVGSLSLGGVLGTISVLLRQEFFLLIAGGFFVIETISVIIQISYFKYTKKKFFNMTPIHHHYELKGCPEPRLIIRCWIISFLLMLLSLILLKV